MSGLRYVLETRWWATSFLCVSAAAYVTAYDVAPTEEPTVERSWLGLFRTTVRLPEDVGHRH